MLPIINGKSLLDCDENDLNEILNNPDYAESEYLDYKANFSLLEYSKSDTQNRNKALAEFRSDVCSFANSSGGYLIYGVRDNKGIAAEIVGIDILDNNTEKFQLDRKNNLNPVMPKMPSLQFKFVLVSNERYVVIIHVQSDYYAPYIFLENEIDYRIFKRVGNGKRSVGYVELKNMFTNSLSVESEIAKYRQERIRYFRSMEDTDEHIHSQFLLLHIIPDTFMDSVHKKNLFLLSQIKRIRFQDIFNDYSCSNWPIPNVDGLRFVGYYFKEECQLTNNCIAEAFQPLYQMLNVESTANDNLYFAHGAVWGDINNTVLNYIEKMKGIIDTQRIFVGISIIGCKGVITEKNFPSLYKAEIDRDTIICPLTVFDDITDDESVERSMKNLQLEYMLSIGLKNNSTLQTLLKEMSN